MQTNFLENIHRNENLQTEAQAIFKNWFIDFEFPNEEGQPYKSSGGKMIWNEELQKEIPENWEVKPLGEICSCELGGTPSRTKPEYWNGTIPWINSGEINKFRIIIPSETITDLGLKKSSTKLLPAKTTVIAITGATLGQVSLLEISSCANQSVIGIIPNNQIPYEFIYPCIKSNIQELLSHQTGGAQQHINKQNVENLPIIVSTSDIMTNYVNIVSCLYSYIANNCFENQRLADLRDTLLPRLMSGELDVSNVKLKLQSNSHLNLSNTFIITIINSLCLLIIKKIHKSCYKLSNICLYTATLSLRGFSRGNLSL